MHKSETDRDSFTVLARSSDCDQMPNSNKRRGIRQSTNRIIGFARKMRKKPTGAENAFWLAYKSIRGRVPFRRQSPLVGYIADFWFCSRRVILELDGGYHLTPDQQAYDARRSARLCAAIPGLKIIRVPNSEVLADPTGFAHHFNKMLTGMPAYSNWKAHRPNTSLPDKAGVLPHVELSQARERVTGAMATALNRNLPDSVAKVTGRAQRQVLSDPPAVT